MGENLYLECSSGISGDMTVAALLDLGADEEKLRRTLDSLPVDGFSVRVSRVKKSGIDCCDFDVELDPGHENHDHDMEYLYGHEKGGHVHGHEEHGHAHAHGAAHRDHGGAEHPHVHRGLREIQEILDGGDMTDRARALARRIFEILGEAEAKAHGIPADEVHFHEVGAVDSIVDIVAAAVCLDDLHVENVIIPRLCEGFGTVRSQHGILPIPVPATANILERYGLAVQITETRGELITPTGAAIAAAVCTENKLPEQFRIRKIGLGAGKRSYERPGILRAMLIADETK